jgi:hypothetical protein
MTDSRFTSYPKVRIGYLVAGVVTGVLWLAHDGSPLEHAVRLLALMATVMTVSWAVHRIAARLGRSLPRHPVGRFLLAKVGIVVLALVAATALDGLLADANLWVAVGMGAVVALLGPVLHPWLMHTDAAQTDAAQTEADHDEVLERLVTAN